MAELRRTPLEQEHRRLGARLVEFAGWMMPLEYAGTLKEHRAVREAVGIFDLTHLGKVEVRGDGRRDVLQRALSNDLAKLRPGRAQYNLILNDRGGIVDDLIVYSWGEDRDLVVPNAANTGRVLEMLRSDAPGGVAVEHRPDVVTIAVQGPRSAELVGRFFPEAGDLPFMACTEVSYGGARMLLARSGYTGERGYEVFPEADAAGPLWAALLEAGEAMGVFPCGLGARDTLRLEMGYPLHGNDISEDRTPLEAGLGFAVALDKGEFRGRDRLLRQREEGVPARLRGLRMRSRLIPRPHYRVSVDGRAVGETTSGTFSPTLREGIAMAYLDPDVSPGDRVEVDVRGRAGEAEVVKPPFVDSSPR